MDRVDLSPVYGSHSVVYFALHSLCMQDNELVIVLEWAKSGDLAHVLRDRQSQGLPFTSEEVMALFAEVRTYMLAAVGPLCMEE